MLTQVQARGIEMTREDIIASVLNHSLPAAEMLRADGEEIDRLRYTVESFAAVDSVRRRECESLRSELAEMKAERDRCIDANIDLLHERDRLSAIVEIMRDGAGASSDEREELQDMNDRLRAALQCIATLRVDPPTQTEVWLREVAIEALREGNKE